MKVFVFECNKRYGGGLAVVAAEDEDEAFDLLRDEYGSDLIYEYTDLDHCHENKELITTVSKSQVLEAEFYVA